MDHTDEDLRRWIAEARRAWDELRAEMRARFDRDLPLEELLGDRWERARSLGFGDGTSIYQNSYVYGDVKVGANSWIGPFTLLDGTGGLTIGSFCSISSGVQIYTHDSVRWAVSLGNAGTERAPVTIGDGCYIGSQSVIAKGVTIGERSIIGACSFVDRDIPPYSIALGAPCRRRGSVVVDGDGNVSWSTHEPAGARD